MKKLIALKIGTVVEEIFNTNTVSINKIEKTLSKVIPGAIDIFEIKKENIKYYRSCMITNIELDLNNEIRIVK